MMGKRRLSITAAHVNGIGIGDVQENRGAARWPYLGGIRARFRVQLSVYDRKRVIRKSLVTTSGNSRTMLFPGRRTFRSVDSRQVRSRVFGVNRSDEQTATVGPKTSHLIADLRSAVRIVVSPLNLDTLW
jgi:hypothetical protein